MFKISAYGRFLRFSRVNTKGPVYLCVYLGVYLRNYLRANMLEPIYYTIYTIYTIRRRNI